MASDPTAPSDSPSLGQQRRRRRQKRNKGKVPRIRDPRIGKFVRNVMIVLAMGYVALTLYFVSQAAKLYGGVVAGMQRADVRYVLGSPNSIAMAGESVARPGSGSDAAASEAASQWLYRRGGTLTTIGFEPDTGRVAFVSCYDKDVTELGCPPVLGIGIGTVEDRIWFRLGRPSSERYNGEVKTIAYNELGLRFDLRKLVVERITLAPRSSIITTLPRAVRVAVP
jgi:hypothetical protein